LARAAVLGLSLMVLASGLAGCGQTAAASLNDPVATVTGYMEAAAKGDTNGAKQFLQTDINDGNPPATEPTTASQYLAQHKGATWKIVEVPWVNGTTKKACTVVPPQGGELCIVTVEIDAPEAKPVWFHFDVESRYPPGKWLIVNVTEVTTKADDGLPTGNEAHQG
jgi:hypothetical protein